VAAGVRYALPPGHTGLLQHLGIPILAEQHVGLEQPGLPHPQIRQIGGICRNYAAHSQVRAAC
jgi:hypothetical protein